MASKATSMKTPCPMFPKKPGEERQAFAEDIKYVEVHKCTKDAHGKEIRMQLPIPKQPIVINPATTTDQDFVDAYAHAKMAGTYYVVPIGHDPSSRWVPGPHHIRVPTEAELLGDDVEEEEQTPATPAVSTDDKAHKLLENVMKDRDRTQREQMRAMEENKARELELHSKFAETMVQTVVEQHRSAAPPQEVVTVLREQIDDIRKKAARDEDDMRRTQRDELARRDQIIDDLRRQTRDEIGKRDREVEDMRRKYVNEDEEVRRRWRDDTNDLKSKYERELTEARTRGDVRISQLNTEITEVRTRLTAEIDKLKERLEGRIYELEKDNIRLEKELAISETHRKEAERQLREEPSEPAAPSDSPAMAFLQNPQLQEAVGNFAKRILSSDPPAPAQQFYAPPASVPAPAPAPEAWQPPPENTQPEPDVEEEPEEPEVASG